MTIYTATFEDVEVTADQDLFEIVAGRRTVIRRVEIGQYSDAGDAQAEMRPIKIIRGYTTAGAGGSPVTPRAQETGNPAASATVNINNDTPATGGSPHTWWSASFNVMGGWFYPFAHIPSLQYPKDFGTIILNEGERLVVNMGTNPDDALTMNGTLEFEELS